MNVAPKRLQPFNYILTLLLLLPALTLASAAPLKHLMIFGPDHNGAFEKDFNTAQEAISQNEDILILGDRKKELLPKDLEDLLQNTLDLTLERIDKDTRVYIHMHGYTLLSKKHKVVAKPKKNTITRGLAASIKTSEYLKKLDSLTQDPLHIYINSCFGGAANNDIKFLKKGSSLTTHVDANTESYVFLDEEYLHKYFEEDHPKHPRQVFLENIKNVVGTRTYCENLGKNEIFCETFSPAKEIAKGEFKTLDELINWKQKKFVERYHQEVDPFVDFDIPEPITKEEGKQHTINIICSFSHRPSEFANDILQLLRNYETTPLLSMMDPEGKYGNIYCQSDDIEKIIVTAGQGLSKADLTQTMLAIPSTKLKSPYPYIKALIKLGADVNAKDNNEKTILSQSFSIPLDRNKIILALIEAGARVSKEDFKKIEQYKSNTKHWIKKNHEYGASTEHLKEELKDLNKAIKIINKKKLLIKSSLKEKTRFAFKRVVSFIKTKTSVVFKLARIA